MHLFTQATIFRLSQAGVVVCNWVAVWGELYWDRDRGRDYKIMGVMRQVYPSLD